MINMSVLNTAVAELLTNSPTIQLLNGVVERSTMINADPAVCPWIGVYPAPNLHTVARAAVAKSWTTNGGIQVVVQSANLSESGTAASDELEELIQAVQLVLNTDLPLSQAGTGIRITEFSREYSYVLFDEGGSGGLFMPQAIITALFEARS